MKNKNYFNKYNFIIIFTTFKDKVSLVLSTYNKSITHNFVGSFHVKIKRSRNKEEKHQYPWKRWKRADHFQNIHHLHTQKQMVLQDSKINQDHTHSMVRLLKMERQRGRRGLQSITCSPPEVS